MLWGLKMQKYLEYLSFLRWPRGFLTSWQLENSIFFPSEFQTGAQTEPGMGVETQLKTGKFWFSFPTEQIPTFLTTRASSGSLNSVKKEKIPQKTCIPCLSISWNIQTATLQQTRNPFFNSCPRFRVEFWPKNSSSSLFFWGFFFFFLGKQSRNKD